MLRCAFICRKLKRHIVENNRYLAEINMTPMIDVMLVLLVIFMITAPLLTTGINVDLPETKAKSLPQAKDPIIISINSRGEIFIGSSKTTYETLIDQLKTVSDANISTTIYIKGDKNIKYDTIVKVIGIINRAGFSKVSLVTVQ